IGCNSKNGIGEQRSYICLYSRHPRSVGNLKSPVNLKRMRKPEHLEETPFNTGIRKLPQERRGTAEAMWRRGVRVDAKGLSARSEEQTNPSRANEMNPRWLWIWKGGRCSHSALPLAPARPLSSIIRPTFRPNRQAGPPVVRLPCGGNGQRRPGASLPSAARLGVRAVRSSSSSASAPSPPGGSECMPSRVCLASPVCFSLVFPCPLSPMHRSQPIY
uniref:Uncharacterized protein n=1 Tax=Scleropages formosus TaxID=113540 RepID=A0A8C9S8C6_SCLFO